MSDSCNSMDYALLPTRLLCPWDSPGKNTGVGCDYRKPWDLSDSGIKLRSPKLHTDSLLTELREKHICFFALYFIVYCERDFQVHRIHELHSYMNVLFFSYMACSFYTFKTPFSFNLILFQLLLIPRVVFLYILFIFHRVQIILQSFEIFGVFYNFSDSRNRSV